MQWVDVLAVVLLVVGVTAFVFGEVALVHADDLAAFYWLAVGVATVRAATQIARPGAKA